MLTFLKKKRHLRDLLPGLIDIHNHLLPGIDDGAKDPEHSLELIRGLAELGLEGFVATPHIMDGTYPNTKETIGEAEVQLRNILKANDLEHLYLGHAAEYMLDGGFEILLENRELFCVMDNYILVEMSYYRPPDRLDQILFSALNAGYKPILAHPERYNFAESIEDFQKFRTLGCVFQLNLLSLGRQYGPHVRKKAQMLLKKGWYEFAATDTHHIKHVEKLKMLEIQEDLAGSVKNLISQNQIFAKGLN